MPQKFTPENLIALLYNETTAHEKLSLINELKMNAALAEELNDMAETIGMLDEIGFDPHPTSIAIIMEHSAKNHEVHV